MSRRSSAARADPLFRPCLAAVLRIVLGGAFAAGCAPGAPPYARCGNGVGCDGSRCIELLYTLDDGSEGGGPFCSARCSTDADCPEGGVCVSVDEVAPLRFVCASRCDVAEDCFAGLRCTELVGPSDVRALCLPE